MLHILCKFQCTGQIRTFTFLNVIIFYAGQMFYASIFHITNKFIYALRNFGELAIARKLTSHRYTSRNVATLNNTIVVKIQSGIVSKLSRNFQKIYIGQTKRMLKNKLAHVIVIEQGRFQFSWIKNPAP